MSDYCDCEKKPGDIIEYDSSMHHTTCGKIIALPFAPKERKPVYCAHRNKVGQYGNDSARYECGTCEAKWESWEDEPKVVIGYLEAE